jgi:hypothetical protein
MNMEEVRQKFPQYNDLSDGDLAQALHKKFYSDVPYERFAAQIGLSVPAPTGTKQPGLREQGAGLPTAARGFINAAQGPLFNFADEIAAGGSAVLDRVTGRNPGFTVGQLYDRYRDVARGASESYQKENPVVAPLTQAGASMVALAPAMIGRAAPPLTSAFQGIMRAAGIGGAQGAIGGAGTADELSNIPAESVRSGAFGALTGGVLSAAQQAGGATLRNMVARSRNTQTGQSAASNLARERVATALVRDNSTSDRALARLRKLGPEATIADSAGTNTRDLVDTMATMPGRTGDRVETVIRNRQIGRPDRIIVGASGLAGGRQLPAEIADLTKQQATNASPLYESIRNIPVAADERLQRILQRPVIQDAIAQARTAAANADDVMPDIKAGEAVPMAVWDKVKRGLDDVIGLKKRNVDVGSATNAAKSTLADAVRTKQQLLEVLDELVPDYKKARNAFSGPAALKDAMEEGRSMFNLKPVDLRSALAELTESERDAFRVGAAQALRERVGTESGQTAILKFWKEPATRERLQIIYPNTRTFREFEATLLGEGRLKLLERSGRGSQTAARQSRIDDEGAAFLTGAIDTGSALNTSSPLGLLNATRSLYGRVVMPEPVRDEIGRLLLQRGPQAQQTLGDLSRYVAEVNARRGATASEMGLLGGSSINALFGN